MPWPQIGHAFHIRFWKRFLPA